MSLRFWKHLPVYALPVVLLVVLVVGTPWLSRGALYAFFFAFMLSLLLAAVFLAAPLHLHTVSLPAARPASSPSLAVSSPDAFLPYVPRSAREAHATLSDDEFEYLAAAVIMARDKHSFEAHTGKSGDRGVDVRMRNQHGLLVAVQAKRFDPTGTVPSYMVRDFIGTLSTHNAVYGYFVTTASLTADGRSDKDRSPRPIHLIEGWLLDVLLQSRHREIAQCLYEIQQLEGR